GWTAVAVPLSIRDRSAAGGAATRPGVGVFRGSDAGGDRAEDADASGDGQDAGAPGLDETSGTHAPVLGEWIAWLITSTTKSSWPRWPPASTSGPSGGGATRTRARAGA